MNSLIHPSSEGQPPGRAVVPGNLPKLRMRPDSTLLPTVSLADVAEIIWRRRWAIILVTVLSVVFTIVYVQYIRGDIYASEARIHVRAGQEHAPSPTMIDRTSVMGAQVGYAAPEIEMMRSRDLIIRLVDSLDLAEEPRPPATTLIGKAKEFAKGVWRTIRDQIDEVLIFLDIKKRMTDREKTIEAISGAMTFESPVNSNFFTVRLVWGNRDVAREILQRLVDMYVEHRSVLYLGSAATRFFGERRKETHARLLVAEKELHAFEQQHGLVNPDEQRASLLKRLTEAEAGVDSARLDLQLADTALEQLHTAQQGGQEDLASFAVAQYGNTLQQTLASELATTASRLLALQTTASSQDVTIRRLQATMQALSRALAQQFAATAEQRRLQLTLREQQRDGIRAELNALQQATARWQELKREAMSALRAFDFNDVKMNEATGVAAQEAAQLSNIVIVQSASDQVMPVGVRKTSLIMLAAVGGLMLALTYVVLTEFFDHRLKSPQDVERRLNLRLLATVPLDGKGLGQGGVPAPTADAELARTAAALGRFVGQEGMRVLMVTAGADGEGASTVCAHVGRHLSSLLGLRVLMVDLGGRRPGLREYVARQAEPPALVSFQEGRPIADSLAQALPQGSAGARIAVADLGPGGVAVGATRPTLDAIIAAAEGRFDLVIIDAPPWQSGPAMLLAMRASTHVMLVAAAHSMSYEPLERLCADMEEERVELIGCVLNRYRRYLPRWLNEALR